MPIGKVQIFTRDYLFLVQPNHPLAASQGVINLLSDTSDLTLGSEKPSKLTSDAHGI